MNIESRIEFNKVVTNVQWSLQRPLVTCSDGSQYAADAVIFTPSLGVLKARHTSLFTPGLPARTVQAIQHLGWGTLEKFFLEFDAPFWPVNTPDWAQYSILWTPEDRVLVTGTSREWQAQCCQIKHI